METLIAFLLQWVKDENEGPSSPSVKVDTPNQFAPLGSDPKELKDKYKAVSRPHFRLVQLIF
jgi:hypothetical protein